MSSPWMRNRFWGPLGCWLLKHMFTQDAAAPLGSPYIGGPGDIGQLILDQTDGQFSKVGGEFVWPAPGVVAWGNQDWYALQNDGDEYDVLSGKKLILKFRGAWTDAGLSICWFGWAVDNTPASQFDGEHIFYRGNTAPNVSIRCPSGAADQTLALRDDWPGQNNYFQASIALRPYNISGGHWYPGAGAGYAYGAHFFYQDETLAHPHHMLAWYRQLQSRTDPLYPAFSNASSTGKFDYVVIPCDNTAIWHPLFTPTVYDEFTDANGVTLPNHTMTYGGYTWVNAVGVWQITGNQADPDNTALARCYTAITKPDVWQEASMLIPTGASNSQGLFSRRSATTSGGYNAWLLYLNGNTAGNDTFITEVNDGVGTVRAQADNDWADNTTYNLRARFDGSQITFYVDYVQVGNYITAWFNRHATHFGLWSNAIDAARFDNFIVLPRGSGLTRIAYDSFTDPNGTSLDAHTMDEGGLAWVEELANWDIQTNEANADAAPAKAYAITTMYNGWVCCRYLAQTGSQYGGIVFRKSADTGGGDNEWQYVIAPGLAGVDTLIREINNGAIVTRATADGDYVATTRYYLEVDCDGQTITGYVDGTQRGTYATATFNQTAIRHGIMALGDAAARWDQWRVTNRPTLGEYDSALDSF